MMNGDVINRKSLWVQDPDSPERMTNIDADIDIDVPPKDLGSVTLRAYIAVLRVRVGRSYGREVTSAPSLLPVPSNATDKPGVFWRYGSATMKGDLADRFATLAKNGGFPQMSEQLQKQLFGLQSAKLIVSGHFVYEIE